MIIKRIILCCFFLIGLILCSFTAAAAAAALHAASRHGALSMLHDCHPHAPRPTPWAPSWFPDGKWIVFAMYGSIWKVDPHLGIAFELTYNRKYHSSPVWSPDGQWVVYTADDDARNIQLEIVNVRTGLS